MDGICEKQTFLASYFKLCTSPIAFSANFQNPGKFKMFPVLEFLKDTIWVPSQLIAHQYVSAMISHTTRGTKTFPRCNDVNTLSFFYLCLEIDYITNKTFVDSFPCFKMVV